MQRRRRIAAYGLCRDEQERVLLVRAAGGANAGRWFLPGGGVEHGEHPADAVLREIAEETGLRATVNRIRDVVSDIDYLADVPALRQQDRLVFDVTVLGGDLRDERGGSTDRAAWVAAEELPRLSLMPHVARLLGVTPTTETDFNSLAALADSSPSDPTPPDPSHLRHQRFAAYGLVTDPAGNILLTQIANGFPGAGDWHLPGGGTDFGEEAAVGLLRELVEETDQRGRVNGLMGVSHRHHRNAVGPEGVPIDWHSVQVVFRVDVDAPGPPRVADYGGSTAAAAWYPVAEVLSLPMNDLAREMISEHLSHPQ